MKRYRIGISALVILAAFILPWWASVVLGFAASLVIYRYYELIVVGVIVDSLYSASHIYFNWPPTVTMICLALFLVSIYLKQLLIFGR